jgi:hypothetical protein
MKNIFRNAGAAASKTFSLPTNYKLDLTKLDIQGGNVANK